MQGYNQIRAKTTTVLLADGKRVSWFNVSYVKTTKIETGYEFQIEYKYKAQVRRETFKTGMKENELSKYFTKFGLFPFFDGIFINTSKVLFLTEEQVFGPVEKTRILITFVDGLEIQKLIPSTQFSGWKQSYV